MPDRIRTIGDAASGVSQEELLKSQLILQHAHESAKSLLQAFEDVRRARDEPRGATTDNEQDLLRAMLVMAAAGLDSMTKQIIKDNIRLLADRDPKVEQGLETFVARRLKRESEEGFSASSQKFMARLLVARSRRDKVAQEYIQELTGGSLQSPEELMKAAFALGIDPGECCIRPEMLRPIFDVRNDIIHELDIDFQAPRRRRHTRSRRVMVEYTNTLLEIAERIFVEVNRSISQASS